MHRYLEEKVDTLTKTIEKFTDKFTELAELMENKEERLEFEEVEDDDQDGGLG